MAGIILEALRVVDSCQLLDEALRLHHLTGLLALQHDRELLDGVQRDLLAAMLRERGEGEEERRGDSAHSTPTVCMPCVGGGGADCLMCVHYEMGTCA